MNRYIFSAEVTGLACVMVIAENEDQAIAKIECGEWTGVEGSQETEWIVRNDTHNGYLDYLESVEEVILKDE